MGVAATIGAAFSKAASVLTGGVIDKAIDLIDKAVSDKDLAQQLKAQLETLRLTQAHEIELARIELEKTDVVAEAQIEVAQQVTFQAEVNQADLYTKQTRPKIARTELVRQRRLRDFVLRQRLHHPHGSDVQSPC